MDTYTMPQIGEILEQGGHASADAAKTAASDVTHSFQGQVGIKNEPGSTALQQQGQDQAMQAEPVVNLSNANLANEETAELVRDFYAPTQSAAAATPQMQEEAMTQQKLTKLRQDLHDQTYYDPLFSYEHKQEERPAETAEKEEEQKKMMELEQKEEEKKLPLAVQRAQTSIEVNRGVSG